MTVTASSQNAQVWQLIKPTLRATIAVGVLSALEGLIQAAMLVTLGRAAAEVSAGRQAFHLNAGGFSGSLTVRAAVGLVVVMGLAALVLDVVVSAIAARASGRELQRARVHTLSVFLNSHWRTLGTEREGRLQELMSVHAPRRARSIFVVSALLASGLNFTILVAVAISASPFMAAAILVAALLMAALFHPMITQTRRSAREEADLNLEFGSHVAETVTIARDLRTFGVEEPRMSELTAFAEQAAVPYVRTQFLSRVVPGVYQIAAVMIAAAALGASDLNGSVALGAVAGVVLLLLRAFMYSQSMQSYVQQLNELLPYVGRLTAAEATYVSQALDRSGAFLAAIEDVRLNGVSFAYGDDGASNPAVLRGLDFSCSSGEIVGIQGPSGVGKSTLSSLLMRLLEPTEGEYLLNGTDARGWSYESFTRVAAFVPQEPRLLRGTLEDNIQFYRSWVTGPDVLAAATQLRLVDEVGGLDTFLAERGRAVSGGQRQRIALARAFAAGASFLVLDEPTSALDEASAEIIHESLLWARSRGTCVAVISHRPEALDICDRVLVLRSAGQSDWSNG